VEPSFSVPSSFRPVFTAGGTISRAMRALFDKPLPYLALAFVMIAPSGAAGAYMFYEMQDPAFQQSLDAGGQMSSTFWLLQVLAMLWFLPGFGALIHASAGHLQGKPLDIGASLGVGLRRMFPLLGVYIVFSIAITLGFIALFVPGFIVLCMYYMSLPVAVLERRGVFGALGRAGALSKGYRTTLFAIGAGHVGVSLAVYLGGALAIGGLSLIAKLVAGETAQMVVMLPPLVLVYIGLVAFFPILVSAAYVGLLEEKESGTAEQVAGVFS
jgi:hypothetical protein